jgi:hypothetical protein
MTIEVHEFSTGITPERTADGGWVSRGFTGRYMNSTLKEVPHEVERSIANKEFAVAEGASSDRPTIIGRVVGTWSVVAIVTKGRDEKGRSASFYRYFLTQDANGLTAIVTWLEEERDRGNNLTFNPYDQKRLSEANLVRPSQHSSAQSFSYEHKGSPLLLDPQRDYTVQAVNDLAQIAAKQNRQPISWAFNVEALEQAARFQVIYPASASAIPRIQQSLAAGSLVRSSEIDEQAIKSAIKNLVNSSQIKPESVQTLAENLAGVENALGGDGADKFWDDIFDGQGAGNALRQKIFSPQMARLLTIRAMLLPHTIIDFLDWLQINDSKQSNEQLKASSALQAQISKLKMLHFDDYLITGANYVIQDVFKMTTSVESASWLFASSGGVWKNTANKILDGLENHLSPKRRSNKGISHNNPSVDDQIWEPILRNAQIHGSFNNPSNSALALAKMMSQLNRPALSAYFYQKGQELVPQEEYAGARNHPEFVNGQIFGIRLKRQKSLVEQLFDVMIHPVTLGCLAIFVVLSGLYVTLSSLGLLKEPQEVSSPIKPEQPSPTTSTTDSLISKKLSDIQVQDTQKAKKGFNQTRKELLEIVQKLEKDKAVKERITLNGQIAAEPDFIRQEVHKALVSTLLGEKANPESLGNKVLTDEKVVEAPIQEKWISAIALYQQARGEKSIDGIIGPTTRNSLLKDIQEYIINPPSSTPMTTPDIPDERTQKLDEPSTTVNPTPTPTPPPGQ